MFALGEANLVAQAPGRVSMGSVGDSPALLD